MMSGVKSEPKKRGHGVLDFLKTRGRAWLLVVGVVLGALLLLIGSGFETQSGASAEATAPVTERAEDLATYCDALEKEIGKLCDAVAGVSDVDVLVTLESGYRVIYVSNEKGAPATVGGGSNQQALYQTLCPPSIAGVSVVCHGGDRSDVQHALTDLVSTALGIPFHKVCVAGK